MVPEVGGHRLPSDMRQFTHMETAPPYQKPQAGSSEHSSLGIDPTWSEETPPRPPQLQALGLGWGKRGGRGRWGAWLPLWSEGPQDSYLFVSR